MSEQLSFLSSKFETDKTCICTRWAGSIFSSLGQSDNRVHDCIHESYHRTPWHVFISSANQLQLIDVYLAK